MPSATCPYLGLKEDSETALAYASPWNYCFRFDVPAQIALEHQDKYCLALTYVECPIYLGAKNTVSQESNSPIVLEAGAVPVTPDVSPIDGLGEELLETEFSESNTELLEEKELSSRNKMIIPLGIAFLALIVIWGIIFSKTVWKGGFNSEWISSLLSKDSSATATITSTVMESPITSTTKPTTPNIIFSTELETSINSSMDITFTPSPTHTKAITQTVSPKTVSTSTQYPSTVPCGAPYGWVQYRVKLGDTLFSLSKTYGVSISQLQTANCMGTSQELFAGTLIYVPFAVIVPTSSKTNTAVPTKSPTSTNTSLPSATKTPVPATAIPPTQTAIPDTVTPESIPTYTIEPTSTLEVLETETPVGGE